MMQEFVPIYVALIEHIELGNFPTSSALGVYLFLQMNCDRQTGIYRGNGARINTYFPKDSLQQTRRSLDILKEGGYINYDHSKISLNPNVVLINKFKPTFGKWTGYQLDAFSHEDCVTPEYVAASSVAASSDEPLMKLCRNTDEPLMNHCRNTDDRIDTLSALNPRSYDPLEVEVDIEIEKDKEQYVLSNFSSSVSTSSIVPVTIGHGPVPDNFDFGSLKMTGYSTSRAPVGMTKWDESWKLAWLSWRDKQKPVTVKKNEVLVVSGTFDALNFRETIHVKGDSIPGSEVQRVLFYHFLESLNEYWRLPERNISDRHAVERTFLTMQKQTPPDFQMPGWAITPRAYPDKICKKCGGRGWFEVSHPSYLPGKILAAQECECTTYHPPVITRELYERKQIK